MTFWWPLVVNPHRRGGFFSPPKRPVPTGRAKLPAANRPTVVRDVIGVTRSQSCPSAFRYNRSRLAPNRALQADARLGSYEVTAQIGATRRETDMFITVIHHIHDPAGFQAAEDKAIAHGLPSHVALPIHAATEDHRLGICIWEGASLSAVRELVEAVVGPYSKNEYFEMHVDGLTPQLGR